jgi:hypothetical protein
MKKEITYKEWLQKKLGNAFKVIKATQHDLVIKIICIDTVVTDWDASSYDLWKKYRNEKSGVKAKDLTLPQFLKSKFGFQCYIDRRKDHFRMKPYIPGSAKFKEVQKALLHVKGVEVSIDESIAYGPHTGYIRRPYKQLIIRTVKRPSEIFVKSIKK